MPRDAMMSLDVVHPNAAGIDIGNAAHYVAVPPDRDAEPVRTFECFTEDLHNNSFRPTEEICVLRTYWRQRDEHVKSARASLQRMQKVLTEMNVQIANVITDISGVTGMAILNAILGGERDRYKLAALADPRVQASQEEIAKSLEGNWRPELLFILRQQMQTYGAYQKRIEECDEALAAHLMTMEDKAAPGSQPPLPKAGKRAGGNAPQFNLRGELYRISGIDLTRIDGINVMIAQTLVAEVGLDMSKWPTEAHFASWLGLCPTTKSRVARCTIAAAATSRTGRPRPSAWRPRVCGAARRTWERNSNGCALLWERPKRSPPWPTLWQRLVYRMLRYGQDYVDKGRQFYQQRYQQQQINWMQKKAKDLGLVITLAAAPAAN